MKIYDFNDYRDFLRERFQQEKNVNSIMSYRYLAKKIFLSHSHIVKVFKKERHFTKRNLNFFFNTFKLESQEQEYLSVLFEYNTVSLEEKSSYKHKLFSLLPIELQVLTQEQCNIFHNWYMGVIHVLMNFYDFDNDYRILAKRLEPTITEKQAKEAIQKLESFNLIKRDKNGRYSLLEPLLTTGHQWTSEAIREFQLEMLSLAIRSLKMHPKEERNFSTLTISVNRSNLADITNKIDLFRKSIMSMPVEENQKTDVYQLNIQLFPLTNPES